jgi:biopolymer transport protein ExbB/TolQ
MSEQNSAQILFNWTRNDIEQRFRFKGGKFTDTNPTFTFISATIATTLFYLGLSLLSSSTSGELLDKFTERGYIPIIISFFFSWTITILILKRLKTSFQRSLLTVAVIPTERGFTLNPETAQKCLQKIEQIADNPANFIVLNRISVALSNLKNIGNISDVSAILSGQSLKDEQAVASSFNLASGFIWAIPVFGFIGTVIGLAEAIQGFGATLQLATDLEAIKSSMTLVVQGLSTAFDTTLLALVAAVILQLLISFQKRKEIQLLDECDSYCQQQIINKLRLIKNEA